MKQERRVYRSPRREAQAEATRDRLLVAARALFADRGWAGTTLKEVAREAGVAEPTVYAVFGNKAGLALGFLEVVDGAADVPALFRELGDAHSPRDQLAAVARFEQRLYDGARDLVRMLQEGSRTSDELAAAYADGNARGEVGRQRVFESWPPGAFRDGVDISHALAASAVVFSFETWELLTSRGWSSTRIADWCVDLLARELLA
jgi:TetR/AcrR family transcriptional regulator, regulator of cefoperazone and chloramphenicol sensitivity